MTQLKYLSHYDRPIYYWLHRSLNGLMSGHPMVSAFLAAELDHGLVEIIPSLLEFGIYGIDKIAVELF